MFRRTVCAVVIALALSGNALANTTEEPAKPEVKTKIEEVQSEEVVEILKSVVTTKVEAKEEFPKPEPKEPEKPKRAEYSVVGGDTLTSIAERHASSWQRLWSANAHLQHPDVLQVGDKISIPLADEQIPERPLPGVPQAPATAPVPQTASAPAPARSYASAAGFVGTKGYAIWGGNCVNEPGVNNPRNGNPINWPATSQTPWIGATALFHYNHVGVVTGIYSNGDLEIRHQNFKGNITRFPRSAFRGFR